MMEDFVIPALAAHFTFPHISHRTLLTVGIGESFLAEQLKDFEANLPIYQDILNLSEGKSHLKFLRNINVQEGVVYEKYGSDKEINYVSQVGTVKKDTMIEKLQIDVDLLQEKIDIFNHATSIEIDL